MFSVTRDLMFYSENENEALIQQTISTKRVFTSAVIIIFFLMCYLLIGWNLYYSVPIDN